MLTLVRSLNGIILGTFRTARQKTQTTRMLTLSGLLVGSPSLGKELDSNFAMECPMCGLPELGRDLSLPAIPPDERTRDGHHWKHEAEHAGENSSRKAANIAGMNFTIPELYHPKAQRT